MNFKNHKNEKDRINARSDDKNIDRPSISYDVEQKFRKARTLSDNFFNKYEGIDLSRAKEDSILSTVAFTITHGKNKFDCLAVGEYLTTKSIWQWDWTNGADFDPSSPMIEVRNYGFNHGIELLTKVRWKASHEDAKQMTAVAMLIKEGQAMFSVESGVLIKYFVISK
jgi:hypothetical protein